MEYKFVLPEFDSSKNYPEDYADGHNQCMTPKSDYLKHTKVLWHLDDNEDELYSIKINSDVNPIDVNFSTWKEECEALLEKYLKQIK